MLVVFSTKWLMSVLRKVDSLMPQYSLGPTNMAHCNFALKNLILLGTVAGSSKIIMDAIKSGDVFDPMHMETPPLTRIATRIATPIVSRTATQTATQIDRASDVHSWSESLLRHALLHSSGAVLQVAGPASLRPAGGVRRHLPGPGTG